MFDKQRMFQGHGISEIIKTIAANRESGSLQIGSGTTLGSLLFHQGQLVDARLGDLTGFQAVNALASVRDAHFSFDPSVTPPSVSSISPTERAVLRQFFGIETAELPEVAPELIEATLLKNPNREPAIEMSDVPNVYEEEAAVQMSEVHAAGHERAFVSEQSSKPYIVGGIILAVLCIVAALAAVTMRKEYRARVSSTQVETTPANLTTPDAPIEPSPSSTASVHEPVATSAAPATSTSDNSSTTVDKNTKEPVATDLTGRWSVINTVQKTSFRPYDNLQIGFDLSINQSGDTFTGRGEKVTENGRRLPSGSRTPIEVKGSVKGDRVEATFFEAGAQRKTNGRFVWRIDKVSGGLTGSFVTTAARSKGTSSAKKS